MATVKLSDKQLRALRACAAPLSGVGMAFWHDARARDAGNRPLWPGFRRTLGSLSTRGLVEYGEGWSITEKGRALLNEIEASR